MQNEQPITFQQYVDKKYNLQNMGPYDYMEFCKKMREPEFKNEIFNTYKTNFIPSPKLNISLFKIKGKNINF